MSQELTQTPPPTRAMALSPSKVVVQQRVEEILSIRLDGAQFWDVESYVREQEAKGEPPWQIPGGATPLSTRTIWRYIEKANTLWRKACEDNRDKLLFRHLAQRKHIYTKAMAAGDYRTALAAVRDEAELLSLYPKPAVSVGAAVVNLNITETVIEAPRIEAQPLLIEHTPEAPHESTSNGTAPDDQATPCPEGVS